MHFGEHLMIDGYGGDESKLNDRELVLQCLNELPRRLEMNILGEPVVYLAPGNDKKDPGGWSGFVVIMESHISIHTFPKKGFLSEDVYTCKNDLDTDAVSKYFIDVFGLKDVEVNFVKRGTRYN
jgi:S-adenosylmethionine decarboxylase